jgi:hypothetical protein
LFEVIVVVMVIIIQSIEDVLGVFDIVVTIDSESGWFVGGSI